MHSCPVAIIFRQLLTRPHTLWARIANSRNFRHYDEGALLGVQMDLGPSGTYDVGLIDRHSVMDTFLKIFIVMVLALAFIGWLADRRAAAKRSNVTPGLSLLPGDIKYESPNGNVRVYFPIVTSIVLSVVLTLILRFFS
jgi:hypothetical protein